MSFELFRRIATDAITTPDLLPTARPAHPGPDPGPVIAACATLASVTDVDPSTPAPGQSPAPALTADDLVRLTGGRLLARSDRPDPRRRRRLARWSRPGELFVALPGERTDGHAYLADAIAAGRGRARRRPGRSPTRPRSAT